MIKVSQRARFGLVLTILLMLPRPTMAADLPLSVIERREAEQLAKILGIGGRIADLAQARARRAPGDPPTAEEVSIRQELLEDVERTSLDVDSVLAELSSERNRLGDVMTSLQNRRDRTVGRLNTAALLAGSGLAGIISATQFHSMSNRTQDVGDAIGIGSGVASTVLSILATRRQSGPSATVGEAPNMLAPLLGGTPVLNTYYPPSVKAYLETAPVEDGASEGSRLDQLKASWATTGRLDSSADSRKISAVTASGNDKSTRVSIQDLTDRIAMLGDVMGRVSLMKRDLSLVLRFYAAP